MCDGVSLSWREFPDELIEKHGLQRRVVRRSENADREIHFINRDRQPVLPVWAGGQLWVWTWGPGAQSRLPRNGCCHQESLDAGRWSRLEPEPVEIPTSYALQNSLWYHVVGGIRGILVYDPQGMPHVYVLTQPSSHYYKVMTRSDRMPVFLGEGI
jgi:hypothetical protein